MKTQLVIDKLLEVQLLGESESQKLQQDLVMEDSTNFVSFDVLGKGEGGNTHFETVQSILFPQEKLFDSLTDLGYRT